MADPTSVVNIAKELSDANDIASGLVVSSSNKKLSDISYVKEYLGLLSSADNPTPAGRAASFTSFESSKVYVEFEVIGRRLRRRVLEAATRERHGDDGLRILRLLLDTGKMDEKQVCVFGALISLCLRSAIDLKSRHDGAKRCPTAVVGPFD
jgi:DNA-directed RNA polymerase III subunit RPC3